MSLPGNSGALRGAIDLSSLGRPAPAPQAGGPGLLTEVTDETFEESFLATRDVPALFVMWDSEAPQTKAAVDAAVTAAEGFPGRVRVVSVDARTAPRLVTALQVQQIPVTMAILAGQPVPLFAGVQPAAQLQPIVEQVLTLAAQSGVTGTFVPGDGAGAQPEPDPMAGIHAVAYDAIEAGDYAAAAAAYEQALKDNPRDELLTAGLAQVKLLQRTQGADLQAARKAAADDPTDVEAGMLVADLDLSGGHVEDAFARLVDLVRVTADEERERVRAHLLELFAVVGATDERVVKARRALMSALF